MTTPEQGLDMRGERPAGDSATRSQIRGSALLMAGQAFAVLVNLAAQVVLVRYLSKPSYGAFAFALSIVQVSEIIASFGLRRGVNRFLPLYEERGERAKAAGLLVFAFGAVLGLSLAIAAIVIGLRGVIAGGVDADRHAATVLAVLIVLTPVHALESLLDNTLAVFSRPGAIALRKHVYVPVMRLAVVVLLALSGSDLPLLAWGWVLVGIAGLVVYGTLLVGELSRRGLWVLMRRRQLEYPLREMFGYTLPLLSTDLAAALFAGAGSILLGVLASASDVASFRAVLPVSLAMTYIVSNFNLLFVPLAARLHARGDDAEVNRLYWQTTAWVALLALPLFLTAFAFAEPLCVALFGANYADSGDVLAVLVIGHFTAAATGANSLLLGVYGHVRYVTLVNLLNAAAMVALNLALIPPFGALGAAIASTAALTAGNLAFQVGLARLTPIRGVDPAYRIVLTGTVAIAAALWAAGTLLHPPLVAGVAASLLAWAGMLLLGRRQLALGEAFPELARIPFLRPLLGAGRTPT